MENYKIVVIVIVALAVLVFWGSAFLSSERLVSSSVEAKVAKDQQLFLSLIGDNLVQVTVVNESSDFFEFTLNVTMYNSEYIGEESNEVGVLTGGSEEEVYMVDAYSSIKGVLGSPISDTVEVVEVELVDDFGNTVKTKILEVKGSVKWLPEPGDAPDSFFYGFKRFFEGQDLSGISEDDEVALVNKHLEFSELRLSEANAMFEADTPEFHERLLLDYNKEIFAIISFAENSNEKTALSKWLVGVTSRHWDFLNDLETDFSDSSDLVLYKNLVSGSHKASLGLLGDNDALFVINTSITIAEDRLSRAKQAAVRDRVEIVDWELKTHAVYLDLVKEFASKKGDVTHTIVVERMIDHLLVIDSLSSDPSIPDAFKQSLEGSYDKALSVRSLSVEFLEGAGVRVPIRGL